MNIVAMSIFGTIGLMVRNISVSSGELALYRALMAILVRQNVQTVYACVTMPNDKSVALHTSLGFDPAGVWSNAGFKHGRWRDVAWFEKSIGTYAVPPKAFTPITEISAKEIDEICASYSES